MLMGFTSRSYSQGININEIIQAGGQDFNTYVGNYISPFMDAFGTGINAGWYNDAQTHEKLGFDLSITFNIVVVPEENRLFTFDENDYSNLYLDPAQVGGPARTAQLPTVMGPDPQPPTELVVEGTINTPAGPASIQSPVFDAPGGIQGDLPTSGALTPMVQIGIGTVKNTDLIIRWLPRISAGDQSEAKVFGLGIKHDIKQWIPGLKTAPMGLSILIAYTNLQIDYSPESTTIIQVSQDALSKFDLDAWTFQALVSKTFSVLTLYGGVGYNLANSNLTMTGQYGFLDTGGTVVFIDDPVNLDFSISGARLTAGFRLKLAIFTLNIDYTLQEYNTLTLGFGFSVR